MITPLRLILALLCSLAMTAFSADTVKPLRALYVTGGCCHDYARQKVLIPDGISGRANVEWTVVEEGGSGTKHQDIEHSIYQNPDWAKGYDIVFHNECFADDADAEYIERVLAPHRNGLPAIVIHCTMHNFRALKTDHWREFLGVTSTHHGPQYPIDAKNLKPADPIMTGFPALWTTGNEELYAIDKVWPDTIVLATAPDKRRESGQWVATEKQNAIIWAHTYGKGRVFGTTLAHHNETMENPIYLNLLSRGLLWACDKLDETGNPKPGYEAPVRK
ncbi:MAG: ThuA domain-containing protein [Limisphaerales bacterium]